MELPEAYIPEIKAAVKPALEIIARRSADIAKPFLVDLGVHTGCMSHIDIMFVAATAETSSLIGLGFFDYAPPVDCFSIAADHFAKTCPDPVLVASVEKAGAVYDNLLLNLLHFTPVNAMVSTAFAVNGQSMTFPPITELKPCSAEAIRWAQGVGKFPFNHVSASPLPLNELQPLAAKIAIEVIKEKELITEAEVALLLSLKPKGLGNRRRANEVNRAVFVQKTPNAKVWYNKAKTLAALQSDTFFVTPKPGKKK